MIVFLNICFVLDSEFFCVCAWSDALFGACHMGSSDPALWHTKAFLSPPFRLYSPVSVCVVVTHNYLKLIQFLWLFYHVISHRKASCVSQADGFNNLDILISW